MADCLYRRDGFCYLTYNQDDFLADFCAGNMFLVANSLNSQEDFL